MLPYRRRPYLVGAERQPKPNVLVRLAFAAIVLLLVWWVASKAMSFFDNSIGRKAGTTLELRTQDGVQVSLQGEEWQRGESSLKLYAGDAIATRGAGDAVLQFFDGTRVRLDVGTDLLITTTDKQEEGSSEIKLELRSGRVWVSTPSATTFSGSIVRSIHTTNFDAEVPAATNAIISSSLVNVLRASGVGVKAAMTFAAKPVIYIGEGQYFSLTEQAKRAIEEGQDAYDFRDPVTLELLKDAFLVSSLTMTSSMPMPSTTGTGAAASTPAPSDEQPLVLSSPADRAQVNAKTVTVSGRLSTRVTRLTINGQEITLKADRSFSVDVAMSKDPTTTLNIQAEDAQGIPLASVQRILTNAYKPVVEPPRIKSPVGSGETLTTSLQEVEITGEAAPNTAGIIVNDYRLQLFKPGGKTWSYLASTALSNLKSGENTFVIYAIDADGNKSDPRSIKVILEGTTTPNTNTGSTASQPPLKQNPPIEPGTLTVDAPVAGTTMETDQKEIVLEGRTSVMTSSISVNGYTLALYQAGKSTWNYIASVDLGTMKRGRNVYRVVSRNADGEILDVLEYVITFKP